MPQGDRTGPRGQGPKTGRQLGDCEDAKPVEGNFGRGFGRGMGNRFCPRWGFGRFGARNFQSVQFTETDTLKGTSEKKILEQELKELDLDKKEIEKRLKELKA